MVPRAPFPAVIVIVLASLLALAASACTSDSGTTPSVPSAPDTTTVGDGLPLPDLSVQHDYEGYLARLPRHFTDPDFPLGDVPMLDNDPAANRVTNAGANLGRVLFYDPRLSRNNTVRCGTCHIQSAGFSDTLRFSVGLDGIATPRHSMGLTNARYYLRGRTFWDERARTIEDQTLIPVQDSTEMDMDLDSLVVKLGRAGFYGGLFAEAFGDSAITPVRIQEAVAQFVRTLVSYNSRFDAAFAVTPDGLPDFAAVFTEEELLGLEIFGDGSGAPIEFGRHRGCDQCHRSVVHSLVRPVNNGLNLDSSQDPGAGDGEFKSPSLRNVAARTFFMHDGRFSSLREVIEFYDHGVQDNPHLSRFLRDRNSGIAPPDRLRLTEEEKDALEAFLHTLTDSTFLASPLFSDPFPALR